MVLRPTRMPDRPDNVEIGDDTTHLIQHINSVPFGIEDNKTYIKNALHVLTIMKNYVLVGQIMEQGMQV